MRPASPASRTTPAPGLAPATPRISETFDTEPVAHAEHRGSGAPAADVAVMVLGARRELCRSSRSARVALGSTAAIGRSLSAVPSRYDVGLDALGALLDDQPAYRVDRCGTACTSGSSSPRR